MKKIILLTLIIFTLLSINIYAMQEDKLLTDAPFLSQEQKNILCDKMQKIYDDLHFDMRLIIYTNQNDVSPKQAAEQLYSDTGFGVGEDRDGLILSVNLGDNKGYCFFPSGIGNKIFDSKTSEQIFNDAFPLFENSEDFNFLNCLIDSVYQKISSYTPPKRLADNLHILKSEFADKTLSELNSISQTRKFDIVIVCAGNIKNLPEYAANYYKEHMFGFGEKSDGMLLLISGTNFYIYRSGYATQAFTSYGIEKISNHIEPFIKSKDYEKFISVFLDDTEMFLKEAFEKSPYSVSHPVLLTLADKIKNCIIILSVILFCVLILILIKYLRHKKTAR